MDATEGRRGKRSTPIGPVVDASSDHKEDTDSTECFTASINVVHQRRRVNPESLALRLGPELVHDLDALIVSGNMEMPSFAVRKELQQRYNIDRRHIYDYFHSRGLRVVKEEKHVLPKDPVPTPLVVSTVLPYARCQTD
ncbi:hypothetical protein PAXRUDRAFT_184301 [Paxillus rubicundulus Ve08.2h10]|uniref:Uncharacterized protein n=1 Tax=Paxillus rubicundulus Ve08.2h10 TaxID=930991 RepID=A0A0D0EB76_9AGAM|nr:hypothetical protein PAXRUDRAFT_184301 [Paxillus rubicundulus Ve08.2h10]